MKNIILSLLIISFACSCTKIEKTIENNQLYKQYKHLISLLNNGNYSDASNLVSDRSIKDLKSNKLELDSLFHVVISINDVVANETGYFEKTSDNKACLTIVGYDSSNDKTAINVEYIYEASLWKLDFVQLQYLLNESDKLPTEATCPTK